MESIEEIRKQKKEADEFTEWRKEVNEKLPELSRKIFALRSVMYKGCGFHWSLEKSLGSVIREINNYDAGSGYYHDKDCVCNRIVLKVCVEHLFEDVERIEKEIGHEV